jgi:hypothetical protein
MRSKFGVVRPFGAELDFSVGFSAGGGGGATGLTGGSTAATGAAAKGFGAETRFAGALTMAAGFGAAGAAGATEAGACSALAALLAGFFLVRLAAAFAFGEAARLGWESWLAVMTFPLCRFRAQFFSIGANGASSRFGHNKTLCEI